MHPVRTLGFPARVRFLIGCSEEDEEGEPAALQGIVTNYYDLFIPQTPKDIQKMLNISKHAFNMERRRVSLAVRFKRPDRDPRCRPPAIWDQTKG